MRGRNAGPIGKAAVGVDVIVDHIVQIAQGGVVAGFLVPLTGVRSVGAGSAAAVSVAGDAAGVPQSSGI